MNMNLNLNYARISYRRKLIGHLMKDPKKIAETIQVISSEITNTKIAEY